MHKLLLANNITIIEGLNLTEVKTGIYEIICMPLRLQCTEGVPARVFLREII